jgi:hypothetical protein
MSANPVLPMEESPEAYHETLTGRIGRGGLSLGEALGYATQIAVCLRDLHSQGLVYGAVSSQLILLGPLGATLRSSGTLAHLGDPANDVAAFGVVLNEMLRGTDGPQDLCEQMNSLAVRCQDDAPGMKQVAIALRLLRLEARHGAVPVRRLALAPRPKAAARKSKVRVRVHLSLHWKPLVNLLAFALSGK